MVSINDKPDDSSIQGFIQSPDFAKKFAGLERSMHKLESEGPEDFLHSLSMSLIAKMIVCIDSKELNGEFAASCLRRSRCSACWRSARCQSFPIHRLQNRKDSDVGSDSKNADHRDAAATAVPAVRKGNHGHRTAATVLSIQVKPNVRHVEGNGVGYVKDDWEAGEKWNRFQPYAVEADQLQARIKEIRKITGI